MSSPSVPEWMRKYGVKEGEWFLACKDGLSVFMRPGWPLKLRVSILLILHSHGYKNELAMVQVQKQVESDSGPRIVALSPAAISTRLQKIAIEECRKSKLELDEQQRKRQKPPGARIREVLQELEQEDGTITRVRANCEPRKLFGLAFDEALAKSFITPIENLNQRDRKKLNQRSLIYVHIRPRPATKSALTRRVDDEVLNPSSSKEDQIEKLLSIKPPVQMVFHFIRLQGLPDAKFAAELAGRDAVQSLIVRIEAGKAAEGELKKYLAPIVRAKLKEQQPNLFEEPSSEIPPRVTTGASVGAESQQRAPRAGAESAPPAEDPALVSQPRPPVEPPAESPDWDAVGRAAAQYGVAVSDQWQRLIVAECRKRTTDVTPAEVAQVIHMVGKHSMSKKSQTGWLLSVVPERCEGQSFRAFRDRIRQAEEQQRAYNERQRAQTAAFEDQQRAVLADATATEEDKAFARQYLGIAEVA